MTTRAMISLPLVAPVPCLPSEYISDSVCKPCGQSCATCQTGPNSCERCAANSQLTAGTCSCVDKFFFDPVSEVCESCGPTCATCDDATKCKTCPSGLALGDTLCLKCAANEAIVGDTCVSCGLGCDECSNLDTCTTCEANASLTTDFKCECDDGFFFDSVSGTCTSCGPTCETCDGATKCKTCPGGFALGDALCL